MWASFSFSQVLRSAGRRCLGFESSCRREGGGEREQGFEKQSTSAQGDAAKVSDVCKGPVLVCYNNSGVTSDGGTGREEMSTTMKTA
jgi:hypothetical protein